MTTFLERRLVMIDAAIATLDGRLTEIATALADLEAAPLDEAEREARRAELQTQAADAGGLQTQVQAERDALLAAPVHDVADQTFRLALLAWLDPLRPPTGGIQITAAVQADPVRAALGGATAISDAAAAALVSVRISRRLELGNILALRAAAGSDEAFDEAVFAGYRAWLDAPADRRAGLYDDVAVLLPLRLETLFDEDGVGWRVRLRIIPDEASIRRDNPNASAVETEALAEMWQRTYDALAPAQRAKKPYQWLDTPQGKLEWEFFARRFSGGRAAWLAAAFPPSVAGDAVTINAPAPAEGGVPPNRVSGYPEHIQIWASFAGAAPQFLAETTVRSELLTFDMIGGRAAMDENGNPSLEAEKGRWWVSFAAAKEAGLGLEFSLPAGATPFDISVLYAIGLGDENPEDHFRAQINSGEMAYLAFGAPTNVVDGKQAADLAHEPNTWRDVAKWRLVQQAMNVGDSLLGKALAGHGVSLPAMPTANTVRELDETLIKVLWPALWGHFVRDLWGLREEADATARWAFDNLRPQGSLPAIRISTQPYGLLPASTLDAWKISVREGPAAVVEERMRPGLLTLRRHMAGVAESRGTAVGATTKQLLDLIARDAGSAAYAYRFFLPLPLWEYLYGSTVGIKPVDLDAFLRAMFTPVYELMGRGPDKFPEFRHYLAAGDYANLDIPLVTPTTWPQWYYKQEPGGQVMLDEGGHPVPAMKPEEGFGRIVRAVAEHGQYYARLMEELNGTLPDSLLLRLLFYSNLLSAAALTQSDTADGTPLLEPIVGDTAQHTRLDDLAQLLNPAGQHDSNAGDMRDAMMEGLKQLAGIVSDLPSELNPLTQTEAAFRAALDTAAYRVDPWVTGMAARRLDYLAGRSDARFRLGVYGWVDGPIVGAPGPTAGGLIHTPSHGQTLAGVILRDKFLSERLENGDANVHNPWDIQIESRLVRMAETMAEEVRLGSHIYEVLGRLVEQIAATRTNVDLLRRTYPLKAGQFDRNRVCHGLDAIAGLLDSPNPPLALPREELLLIRRALDTYGDLLVAEAVHDVVAGRGDVAGAAMDAAAGLATPPTLEFTQTPAAGYSLTTAVLAVLPYRDSIAGVGPTDSPALLADASVAAMIEEVFGPADQWFWSTPDGASATLADLGFAPADTLALSGDLLVDMARGRLGVERDVPLGGTGMEKHLLARNVVHALGGEPALLRGLSVASGAAPDAPAPDTGTIDLAILAELRARYTNLRAACQRMIDELEAAADYDALRQALFRVLRWGVTPMVTQPQREALYAALFRGEVPDDPDLLPNLALRGHESLKARLDAAPPAEGLKQSQEFSRVIAELAMPEGQLAVLSRIEAADLAAAAGLQTAAPDATLDEDWLAVVAAVRPQMAKLEALQLEEGATFAGFTAWSNTPGDHWRVVAAADAEARRQAGDSNALRSLPPFVAAYTLGAVLGADPGNEHPTLAVGLVDSWGEVIPRSIHTTTAAFGFNAPAARPPQAILIAVPPDLDHAFGAQFNTKTLIAIIAETRELAHARAVQAEDLGPYLAALPTTIFQATGYTGVRLDEDTQYHG